MWWWSERNKSKMANRCCGGFGKSRDPYCAHFGKISIGAYWHPLLARSLELKFILSLALPGLFHLLVFSGDYLSVLQIIALKL